MLLAASQAPQPFFRIRRAAVTVLADIYSPDLPQGQTPPPAQLPANVEQSMLRLTKDRQPLVQAEAIQLLGETRDAKHAAVYLPFLDDTVMALSMPRPRLSDGPKTPGRLMPWSN